MPSRRSFTGTFIVLATALTGCGGDDGRSRTPSDRAAPSQGQSFTFALVSPGTVPCICDLH